MQDLIRRWLNPRSTGARMALLLVAATIGYYATKTWTSTWFPLIPNDVMREFKLWQLGTYIFISPADPFSVIFGVLILLQMGPLLESYWGARKLWLFVLLTAVASGVATILLSLVFSRLGNASFLGGSMIVTNIWVAYGLAVGRGRTNFWGLPTTGDGLALIGVAFVVLFGLMSSWLAMVPALFSLLFTFLYVRLRFPARALERLNRWRLQRQLSKRSTHLKVVSDGQRNMPGDSDKYLH
jgi:membrane associated rhomboid family serine protease